MFTKSITTEKVSSILYYSRSYLEFLPSQNLTYLLYVIKFIYQPYQYNNQYHDG